MVVGGMQTVNQAVFHFAVWDFFGQMQSYLPTISAGSQDHCHCTPLHTI